MKFTLLHWGPLNPQDVPGFGLQLVGAAHWCCSGAALQALALAGAMPSSARRCGSPAGHCPLRGTPHWATTPDLGWFHRVLAPVQHRWAGEKSWGFFLLLFSPFFSCQISLSLCFLGVTCVLQHKQDSTRERLVYSRDSVKCLKEEFSSKKRDGP